MNDGQSPLPKKPTDPTIGSTPAAPSAPPGVPAQPAVTPSASPVATPSAAPTQPVVMQSKQIGKYLVEVINDKCIGAASCVAIAPAVFQLNEDNIAYVVSQDGNDDDTKLLAAQSCPTAAIIVTDTTTGEQVWPRVDA